MQEWPAPGEHAAHVVAREHGGIFVPVGIVETEQLGALELKAGDAPAGRPEGLANLVERAHPHWNDDRGDGAVGSAEIDHAEHPLIRKLPRGSQR